MDDKIRVLPVEGRTMVRENDPRQRITAECEVPNTAYYRRAIARGDLQSATTKAKNAAKPQAKE